jgi:hypothetical protein
MFGNAASIGIQAAESKLAIQEGLQGQIDLLKNLRKKYDEEANLLQLSLTNTFGTADASTTTAKPKKDKTLTLNQASDLIKATNRTNTLLAPKEIALEDTYFEEEKKKLDDFLKFITGHNQKKADLLKKGFDEEKKQLEDLNNQYAQFANTISQTVTGALFGMYDAMQQGASAGEALGQMFSRLLRQMAEMVVQAAIFAGILSLISGGAAGGGVSFMGAFTKILGIPKMAAGGVATGPTLAMIGEGSESEAVLPLSKLSNIMQGSFNAGSMSSGNASGLSQFVLRGQDLLLSVNRAQKASNLKGQNISLA